MSKRDNIISLWRYGGSIVLIVMNIDHRLECLDWNENSHDFPFSFFVAFWLFGAMFSVLSFIRQIFLTLWSRIFVLANVEINFGSRHSWKPGRWLVLSPLEHELFFLLVTHFWCILLSFMVLVGQEWPWGYEPNAIILPFKLYLFHSYMLLDFLPLNYFHTFSVVVCIFKRYMAQSMLPKIQMLGLV